MSAVVLQVPADTWEDAGGWPNLRGEMLLVRQTTRALLSGQPCLLSALQGLNAQPQPSTSEAAPDADPDADHILYHRPSSTLYRVALPPDPSLRHSRGPEVPSPKREKVQRLRLRQSSCWTYS